MYQIPILGVRLVRDSSQKSDQKIMNGPKSAADVTRKYLEGADREHLVVLCLDKQNKMIGLHTVSVGTIDRTIADPREIYKVAILANAIGIVIAHNHLSDKLEPSPEDRSSVREIAAAGKMIGITLLDAIIVNGDPEKFYSFKQESPYDLG